MKSNPLHVQIFTASFKLESDLIQMVNKIYHGNMESCGAPTYNLDDQAHCVLMAYWNWAKQYKGITKANVIAFSSIHPRYAKACRNHDVEIWYQKLDPSGIPDWEEFEDLIDENTICLLCSAPCNATGWLDNVEKVA